jgi:hypothetical protein
MKLIEIYSHVWTKEDELNVIVGAYCDIISRVLKGGTQ